jgi:GntR family transcriptional repressor for pyruvate dehydrogenase complex
MKLQIVSNRKLYLQIADQIREQIESGVAAPGQQLPSERDLALSLNVSRPTVREALIALEIAGLIEVRVGVGAFVRASKQPPQDLPDMSHSPLEIMAVRRLLEPETAALAARNIGDAGKRRISGIIEDMRVQTAEGHWSADTDRQLHMAIADGSGNIALRDILEGLWNSRNQEIDRRFHQHLADFQHVRAHIMADHERIATSVIKHDEHNARTAMAEHLAFVENAMLEIWD